MVPIRTLHPGDRVKIVDRFRTFVAYRYANPVSDMMRFLGQIVTIQRTEGNVARIEEDGRAWVWDPEMLDYIVEDTPIIPASEADFLSLLAGKELYPATN